MSMHASVMGIARVALLSSIVTPFLGAAGAPAGQAANSQNSQNGHNHGGAPARLVSIVRDVTRPFLDIEVAEANGYGRFLGCVSGPQEGAMGVHYVNGGFVGDGEIDLWKPEALMYEFPAKGRPRLLGVEYIVDAATWLAHHDAPPVLEGQAFQFVSAPNRYNLPSFFELHVWAWRDNPSGAFVDWNTEVSCEGR